MGVRVWSAVKAVVLRVPFAASSRLAEPVAAAVVVHCSPVLGLLCSPVLGAVAGP